MAQVLDTKNAPQPQQRADNANAGDAVAENDFEKRHAKELGAARFAKIQAAYTLVPIAGAAGGYALGNYVLALPVAKMMPESNKAAAATEEIGKKSWKAISEMTRGKSAAEAFADFGLNEEQLNKIGAIWKDEARSYKNKMGAIADAMELKLPAVSASIRKGTAATSLIIGTIFGSVAVGYDKWHKDESARLAAQEVNADVAKLELFKPSDPELVAENKRLREMVAKLPMPKVEPASVQAQGRVQDKQTSKAMG